MKTVLALIAFLLISIQAHAAIVYCQTPDQKIRAEFTQKFDGSVDIFIANDDFNTKLNFNSSFYPVWNGKINVEVAQLMNHGRLVVTYDNYGIPSALYRIGAVNIEMDCDYGIKPGTMGH